MLYVTPRSLKILFNNFNIDPNLTSYVNMYYYAHKKENT